MPLSGRSFQEQINCPESVSLVSIFDSFQKLLLRKSVDKVISEFWETQGSPLWGHLATLMCRPDFRCVPDMIKQKQKLTCLTTDCKEIKPVNLKRNQP